MREVLDRMESERIPMLFGICLGWFLFCTASSVRFLKLSYNTINRLAQLMAELNSQLMALMPRGTANWWPSLRPKHPILAWLVNWTQALIAQDFHRHQLLCLVTCGVHWSGQSTAGLKANTCSQVFATSAARNFHGLDWSALVCMSLTAQRLVWMHSSCQKSDELSDLVAQRFWSCHAWAHIGTAGM